MRLKGKINNYAKRSNIAAQVVLQNYMFECFLARLSQSEYRQKFIIKGGMLIAAIVGLDTRATMDLDTTLRNLPLSEEKVFAAIDAICAINLPDDTFFTVKSISPIRKDDRYGGFCIRIDAQHDTIITPLSVDVSIGDVITPSAVEYEFNRIFDEKVKIRLWGYNIETVLAEKVETILSRGIFTTRARDYYDIYILVTTKKYDEQIFASALKATAEHRGSLDRIFEIDSILAQISESKDLQLMWDKYQNKFSYATNITYGNIIDALQKLVRNIKNFIS